MNDRFGDVGWCGLSDGGPEGPYLISVGTTPNGWWRAVPPATAHEAHVRRQRRSVALGKIRQERTVELDEAARTTAEQAAVALIDLVRATAPSTWTRPSCLCRRRRRDHRRRGHDSWAIPAARLVRQTGPNSGHAGRLPGMTGPATTPRVTEPGPPLGSVRRSHGVDRRPHLCLRRGLGRHLRERVGMTASRGHRPHHPRHHRRPVESGVHPPARRPDSYPTPRSGAVSLNLI